MYFLVTMIQPCLIQTSKIEAALSCYQTLGCLVSDAHACVLRWSLLHRPWILSCGLSDRLASCSEPSSAIFKNEKLTAYTWTIIPFIAFNGFVCSWPFSGSLQISLTITVYNITLCNKSSFSTRILFDLCSNSEVDGLVIAVEFTGGNYSLGRGHKWIQVPGLVNHVVGDF